MKYQARFHGRKLGAIGIYYPIETVVEGESLEQATLNLLEKYDCCFSPWLKPLEDTSGEPEA